MINSKDHNSSKLIQVECGVCEKVQIIEGLRDVYKNLTKKEASEIFYKIILQKMDEKCDSNDYLSEIKTKLNNRLSNYKNIFNNCKNLNFTELFDFFITNKNITSYLFNKWYRIIFLSIGSLQYKIEKDSSSKVEFLKITSLNFKLKKDDTSFSWLLALSKQSNISIDSLEKYLNQLGNLIIYLVKSQTFQKDGKTTWKLYSNLTRRDIYSEIQYFVNDQLNNIFDSCFLSDFLLPESIYFDIENLNLTNNFYQNNDYLNIWIHCDKYISGYNFWNDDTDILEDKILESVKKSIKLTIQHLLEDHFTLSDVASNNIPISFLTDKEILEGIKLDNNLKDNFLSKNQTYIKSKKQMARFILILKDFLIENL